MASTYHSAYTPESGDHLGGIHTHPNDILNQYPSNSFSSDASSDTNDGEDRAERALTHLDIPMLGDLHLTNNQINDRHLWHERFTIRPRGDVHAGVYIGAPPRFYFLDFMICVSTSISICSISLIATMLFNHLGSAMIVQTISQYIAIGGLLVLFICSDTYKSINCSLDFLPIHWVFYSYSIKRVIMYLLIQIIAAIIGSYATIAMYYSHLVNMNRKQLIGTMIPSDCQVFTPDSLALTLFVHMTMVIGATLILGQIDSLNCNRIHLQALGYVHVIGFIYSMVIGPISFILYRLVFYGALITIFDNTYDPLKDHVIVTMSLNILIKLIIYPLVAHFTRYMWAPMIRRYIEYATKK